MEPNWSLSQGFCATPKRFQFVIVKSGTQKLEDKSVSSHSLQFSAKESGVFFPNLNPVCPLAYLPPLPFQNNNSMRMRPIPSKFPRKLSAVSYQK